jgi:UDP-N-acetylglucosamine 2-epimerase (non-hydrolysing)
MDEGVVIMSGLDKEKILSAIEITVNANKNRSEKFQILDYKNKNVSDQVSKVIFSYIEFINKNVWKKR